MQGKDSKILLVDDDQNLLTSLSDILTYKGFATLRAPTGGKALKIIADQTVEVALIVSQAARHNRQSRGCHFRADSVDGGDRWL